MTRAVATALAAAAFALAGCGSSASVESATPSQARRLLATRLRAKQLDFHWVACVRNGRSYRGAQIVRCNVDFGDPHVEAYCTVLVEGRLVTDHDAAAIPCRHDDAGWGAAIAGSSWFVSRRPSFST